MSGSLLGTRRALEPDHLAAVWTLITIERNSGKAAWLGLLWGLVALMLVALGVRAMRQSARLGSSGHRTVSVHATGAVSGG